MWARSTTWLRQSRLHFLQRVSLGEAMREDLVEFDEAPAVVRAFPRWLEFSPFPDAVRAAARQGLPSSRDRSA